MSVECELLKNCGFIKNLGVDAEKMRDGWRKSFCGCRERSELCQRKLLARRIGYQPPSNLAPTGQIVRHHGLNLLGNALYGKREYAV